MTVRVAVISAGSLGFTRKLVTDILTVPELADTTFALTEVDRLTDEMLVAQAKWLPQYRREIPKVKKRLAAGKALGSKKTRGAARLKVKTPAELRKAKKRR